MLDYYEVKIAVPSTEISELGKLKLLQSLDNWSYRIIGLGFRFDYWYYFRWSLGK
jgi:hypothetical protein